MFKTDQPGNKELLSLAHEIVSIWSSLGSILGLTKANLDLIDGQQSLVLDKSYAMLRKWMESNGSEATYQKLAEGLDNKVIKRRDLVERYCHDKGK